MATASSAIETTDRDRLWSIRRKLFLLSALALFSELLIIRWLATEVRIFAYFKNLPLMSAFLGLGLGFIWSKSRRDMFGWSAIGMLFLSSILMFALGLGITYLSFVDPQQIMMFGMSLGSGSAESAIWSSLRNLAITLGIFALSVSIFVGLGQRMGQLFDKLNPLEAYSINIAGSLAGSVLFSLLSYLGTAPGVWLIVAGLLFLSIQRKPAHFALIVLGLCYAFFLGPYIARVNYGADFVKTLWSPYYRIDVVKYRQAEGPFAGAQLGYNIYINYDTFQSVLDCSPESLARFPKPVQEAFLNEFSTPFKLPSRPPENVLVLGAGSGNDVAAALRAGAKHVDAVEIDPFIITLGKELHPEHPYQSPLVDAHIMDARTYLKNCRKKYDLVLFAALDSHAAFSSLSSLRLDNYIFTRQAFAEASRLLTPSGIISMNFVVVPQWLWEKQARALAAGSGMIPCGFIADGKQVGGLLISGPGMPAIDRTVVPPAYRPRNLDPQSRLPVSTDDWPFLFLPSRAIPLQYVLPMLAILLLSIIPVAGNFAGGAGRSLNWQMLALGMGFMLLEVRAMADLSLLFGSTWIINSVIISGVMVIVLLANWLATRLNSSAIPWLGLALIASLVVTMLVRADQLSHLGMVTGGLLGTALYLFPMTFSSAIFALRFKSAQDMTVAFAFNLIGGLIGVCIEYLSMWSGIKSLGYYAIAIYSVVLLLFVIEDRRRCARMQQE